MTTSKVDEYASKYEPFEEDTGPSNDQDNTNQSSPSKCSHIQFSNRSK